MTDKKTTEGQGGDLLALASTEGLCGTLPASAPGAARHLAYLLGTLYDRCRPGYVMSKSVRAQIDEARAIADALSSGLNSQSETLSKRMRKAGFTRRPSVKSLPSDE